MFRLSEVAVAAVCCRDHTQGHCGEGVAFQHVTKVSSIGRPVVAHGVHGVLLVDGGVREDTALLRELLYAREDDEGRRWEGGRANLLLGTIFHATL